MAETWKYTTLNNSSELEVMSFELKPKLSNNT